MAYISLAAVSALTELPLPWFSFLLFNDFELLLCCCFLGDCLGLLGALESLGFSDLVVCLALVDEVYSSFIFSQFNLFIL